MYSETATSGQLRNLRSRKNNNSNTAADDVISGASSSGDYNYAHLQVNKRKIGENINVSEELVTIDQSAETTASKQGNYCDLLLRYIIYSVYKNIFFL